MKRLSLFGLALLISFLSFSQGLMWVKHFTGTGANQPYATIRDNAGNYYVYGNFNGNVVQDALSLDSYGGSQDIFLSKYNSSGEIQWLKQIGGVGTESAYGLCLSSDGNYVYVSGTFNNTCGIEGTYLANTGSNDIFLAKFQTDGTLTWAYNAAYGSYNHQNGSIAADSDGNIIMAGIFYSSVMFYGDAGQLNYGDPLLRQHFMAKFDGSGNLVWSKLIEGDNSGTYVRSVSAYNNEYYFSGQYIGLLKIGASSVTNSTSYRDGFVFKTNSTGDCQWIRRIEGPDNNEFIINNKTDNSGNVLLAGYFNSARLRIDSTETDTSTLDYVNFRSGKSDIVFMKFSSDGTFQWAKTAGTDQDDKAIDISAYNDKIVVTGSFWGSIWFDNFNLVNKSGPDVFIAECTTTSEFTAVYKASGSAGDVGEACIMNPNERNFLSVGDFYSDTLTIESNNFVNPDIQKRDAYIALYGCFDGVSVSGTNVTCFGLADGTATANPASGSGPYTYLWSNDSTTASILGLTAGLYTVTVSGNYGCTAVDFINITQPDELTSGTSQTNVTCYGLCDGTATATPSGGTSPYLYSWNTVPEQTTQEATGLCQGEFEVTITDSNGCTLIKIYDITQPAGALDVVMSKTNPSTNSSCDGTATATPSGGTGPYTYLWNTSPAQTTQTALNLCGGTRWVTVTDANGCTQTGSIVLVPKTKLRNDFCNIETNDIQLIIYCDPVSSVQDYEWEFTCTGIGYYQTISNVWPDNPSRNYIRISYMQGIVKGYTYDVRVRAKRAGVWGEFGNVCTIMLESTRLTDEYCDKTYNTLNTFIYCIGVSGATNYEFYFYDDGLTFESTRTTESVWGVGYGSRNYLKLSNIPGLTFQQIYNVKVRAYVGGQWTEYGSVCYVDITVPNTKLRDDFCNTVQTTSSLIYCDQVSGAQEYEIKFERPGFSFSRTTSSVWPTAPSRNYMRIYHVTGVTKGYIYDVQVRAKLGGVWGNYGTICTIDIPASKTAYLEEDVTNNVFIYPNPATDLLNIDISADEDSKYTIEICDITGRLIMQEEGFIDKRHYIRQKDVSEWESGLYIVKIGFSSQYQVLQFVKE